MIDEKKLTEEINSFRMMVTGVRSGKGILNEYVNLYKDSILRIIEEQPKVGEWIPVEKELPKEYEEEKHYSKEKYMVSDIVLVTVRFLKDDEIFTSDDITDDKPVLLSFENFTTPLVGRYKEDENGNGAYYLGDEDETLLSQDIFVNAWQPLKERYKG